LNEFKTKIFLRPLVVRRTESRWLLLLRLVENEQTSSIIAVRIATKQTYADLLIAKRSKFIDQIFP